MTATTSEAFRSRSLDILRLVAVLLVLGRHMEPFPLSFGKNVTFYATRLWQNGGWAGVDLFFVLSGYLIGGLLFAEAKRSGNLRVSRFLLRRGLKIYPAFYVFWRRLWRSWRCSARQCARCRSRPNLSLPAELSRRVVEPHLVARGRGALLLPPAVRSSSAVAAAAAFGASVRDRAAARCRRRGRLPRRCASCWRARFPSTTWSTSFRRTCASTRC
jgi:hypothetical protein